VDGSLSVLRGRLARSKLLFPGSRLGPYEILSPLGAGGMGEVYLARDTRLDRTVAVKVLPSHLSQSEEVRQRFEREAKTISSLSHPHICALYDVGNQDGTEYLVMEFLEGETLTDRLSRGPLPTEQVLRYGIAMDDPLLVRGFERLGDLLRDGESFVNSNWTARDSSIQALAVDELEHEELLAVGLVQAVDRADVRMVQRSKNVGFAAEARKPLRVMRERLRQNLHRNVASELGVARAIDLAHAARAEGSEDFIRTEARADGLRH
jgi:hypothetical protein